VPVVAGPREDEYMRSRAFLPNVGLQLTGEQAEARATPAPLSIRPRLKPGVRRQQTTAASPTARRRSPRVA
jgi:hypothetical protein